MLSSNKSTIWILAVFMVIVLIAVCFRACGNDKEVYKSSISEWKPSLNGNNGYVKRKDVDSVKMIAVRGINVNVETGDTDFVIQNPKENNYNLIAKVFLGDGTLLYKSDSVKPGWTVSDIKFPSTLESGLYRNAVVVFEYHVEKNSSPVTRCEFQIELNCFGGKEIA